MSFKFLNHIEFSHLNYQRSPGSNKNAKEIPLEKKLRTPRNRTPTPVYTSVHKTCRFQAN